MKKELKYGILSADKSADCRPTVGGVNVIAVLRIKNVYYGYRYNGQYTCYSVIMGLVFTSDN